MQVTCDNSYAEFNNDVAGNQCNTYQTVCFTDELFYGCGKNIMPAQACKYGYLSSNGMLTRNEDSLDSACHELDP